MKALLLPLALAACAPSFDADVTPAPLPATNGFELAPPPQLSLTPAEAPTAGETGVYRVTGAPAGSRVYLAASSRGEGSGPCPAVLGGDCLGLKTPIFLAGVATADSAGVALISVPIPSSGAPASLSTQALVLDAAAELSRARTDGVVAGPPPAAVQGLPLLGDGSHSIDGLVVEVIANRLDGVANPRDLAFDPLDPSTLWVVNRAENNTILVFDAGSAQPDPVVIGDANTGVHFLAQPAGIDFGDNGYFATVHEEDDYTQGPPPWGTPVDFMGPTLWTSDLNIYDGGHAGHYDMLHNSPNAVGVAWDSGNAYWVFDGYHDSLTLYDFNSDHGAGGADHSDGVVRRYVEGEVSYVPDVSSHMWLDPNDGLLYVADTGNQRIAVLDTATGNTGSNISPNYDGTSQRFVNNAVLTTLVGTSDLPLSRPSGLQMHGDVLYVSDNATSIIYAMTTAGEVLDWLYTGWPEGTLGGLEVTDGALYAVDVVGDRVYRITTP